MIKITEVKNDTIILEGTETISKSDYTNTIEPEIKKVLETNEKINMLGILGKDFDHITISAIVRDFSLFLKYKNNLGRVGFVHNNLKWVNSLTSLFGHIAPLNKIKVFTLDEVEEAKAWVKG